MTLQEVLHRIAAVGGERPHASDARSLLHAYIACLPFSDLCDAIALSLSEPADVRLALRSRLLRLIGETPADDQRERLVLLFEETIVIADSDRGLRQTTDALHSALIRHLPGPSQHALLERWVDRSTRGAMARWMKATRDTPALFDASIALVYWRATRDSRAAKSLAYQASPEALGPIVGELAAQCQEGWIISKAIVRAGCEDEAALESVRSNHPATYLYLCSQLRRPISDDEAFDLVWACPGVAVHDDRGLAIWAIGQMGKVAVLDRIRASTEALFEKDTAEMRARYPDITVANMSGPSMFTDLDEVAER